MSMKLFRVIFVNESQVREGDEVLTGEALEVVRRVYEAIERDRDLPPAAYCLAQGMRKETIDRHTYEELSEFKRLGLDELEKYGPTAIRSVCISRLIPERVGGG